MYNALVDLDEATRGWIADMSDEVEQITQFRDLLVRARRARLHAQHENKEHRTGNRRK